MSRCFPYPPLGYVRGVTSLAESIELQKIKEQEKEIRKEKREHKEKNDKKKRSRESYGQTIDEKQVQKKRRHTDKETKETKMNQKVQPMLDGKVQCLPDHKGQFLADNKVQFVREEQLEKSGLTEELGQPHLTYQCGSPDSSASEDSSKRRRIGDGKKSHVTHATGLRIRFSLAKSKTEEVSPVVPPNILRLPAPAASHVVVPPAAIKSSSVASVPAPLVPKEPEVAPRPSTSKNQELALASSELPSFSGRTEPSTSKQQLTISGGSPLLEGFRGSKKSRKREAKFNDLFLNWAPPTLLQPGCREVEDDDQDWLFNASRQPRRAQRDTGTCLDRGTGGGQTSVAESLCSWPPRACHLEDADVYALPYVVPF